MVCVGGSISGPACSQPQSMMVVMVYREKYAFYGKTSVHRWTFMARVEASRHRVTPPRTYCTASTFIAQDTTLTHVKDRMKGSRCTRGPCSIRKGEGARDTQLTPRGRPLLFIGRPSCLCPAGLA